MKHLSGNSARAITRTGVMLLLVMSLCTPTAAAHMSRVFTSDSPILIPDADSELATLENAVSSTVTVTSESHDATCSSAVLRVVVDHTAPSDLVLWLVTPDEQRIDLPTNLDLATGEWFSVQLISPAPVDGDWTLYISDSWEADVGTLLEWNLVLPFRSAVDHSTTETISVTEAAKESIPDYANATPGFAQSTIDLSGIVPNEARTVGVEVNVSVDHSSVADLSAHLISPDGRQIALHGMDFSSNEAAHTMAPIGSRVAGPWTLLISDNLQEDTGVLEEWTLSVEYSVTPSPELFIDAASNDPLPIPDCAPDAGTTEAVSKIPVANIPYDATIAGTIVTYQVRHSAPADLTLRLSRESGPEVVISDGLATDYLSVFVSEFNGMSPLGEWTLHISDSLDEDEGELVYWSLQFVLDYPMTDTLDERLSALERAVAEHSDYISQLSELFTALGE